MDFEVPEGSVFGLIGPNGAGKTTTIKILMNILQPSAGRAEVLGIDSRRLGPRRYARHRLRLRESGNAGVDDRSSISCAT